MFATSFHFSWRRPIRLPLQYSSSGDYLLATGFEVPVQLIDLRTSKAARARGHVSRAPQQHVFSADTCLPAHLRQSFAEVSWTSQQQIPLPRNLWEERGYRELGRLSFSTFCSSPLLMHPQLLSPQVLWVDGNNNAIVTWGTRSGSVLGRLEKMHSKPIQCVVVCMPFFIDLLLLRRPPRSRPMLTRSSPHPLSHTPEECHTRQRTAACS